MQRLLVLTVLPWLLAGCAGSSNSASGSQDDAVRCAKAWKAKGFDFDPDTMTCAQMYTKAQALRNAAYWQKRGYVFDPNSMTAEEMDREAFLLRQKGIRQYHDPNLAGDRPAGTARAATVPSAIATQNSLAPGAASAGNAASSTSGTAATPAAGTGQNAVPRRDITRHWLQGATLKQVRETYPQYDDLDDLELARRIHATYFADTPFDTFARRFLGDADLEKQHESKVGQNAP